MNTNIKLKTHARLIAFYLPQFHPIPENDKWWGNGFTEWTVVTSAKPLFPGHYQPRIPADLGFYDLRLPEVRIAQAELAKEHGIEGFCYWHYWLETGKQLLERPFEEVLKSGEPDFPFCLGWANHSWKGVYFGAQGRNLIEQKYSGVNGCKTHFYNVLRAFSDERYITVDGKQLFFVFAPKEIPDVKKFVDLWQEMALEEGLNGIYFVGGGLSAKDAEEMGFDATSSYRHRVVESVWPENKYTRKLLKIFRSVFNLPIVYSYENAMKYFLKLGVSSENDIPVIVPNWDTTPRLGKKAVILHNSNPAFFRKHVKEALAKVSHKAFEHRIIFLKSWNEWAEGNYLEPDLKFGKAYLEVIRDENCSYKI